VPRVGVRVPRGLDRLTERIGYWVDLDDPYRTLDTHYIESVWWALKQMWDKDLLYEGFKVVPYCPRDGTALSSHEVSQGYKDVEDPSIYVRFPSPSRPARCARRHAARVDDDAVDAGHQRCRRRRPEPHVCRTGNGEVLAEALASACSAKR
jgi:isoleucyl-tRNA synthetase